MKDEGGEGKGCRREVGRYDNGWAIIQIDSEN